MFDTLESWGKAVRLKMLGKGAATSGGKGDLEAPGGQARFAKPSMAGEPPAVGITGGGLPWCCAGVWQCEGGNQGGSNMSRPVAVQLASQLDRGALHTPCPCVSGPRPLPHEFYD